jgi:hypothetical protein
MVNSERQTLYIFKKQIFPCRYRFLEKSGDELVRADPGFGHDEIFPVNAYTIGTLYHSDKKWINFTKKTNGHSVVSPAISAAGNNLPSTFCIYLRMKFVAFLFSFYILTLNCLPCGDSRECDVQKEQTVSSTSGQEHGHESEVCTPFCTCACCASAGFYPQLVNTKLATPVFERRSFQHLDDDFQSYDIHAVWQPPRA